ncbi:hypothetical protein KAJ27_21125, partial [bacterium]|nr:hypothetical protein [bacterium]
LLLEFFYSAIIIDDLDAGYAFYFENIDFIEPTYFSEHILYPVRQKKGTIDWTGVRYIAFKGFYDNKFYMNLNDLTKSRTIRARILLKKSKKQSWMEIIDFDYSGFSTFIKQHMGSDYEFAVLMLTNIGEFSDGDYEYDSRISGPLIVPFFNPVFPDELCMNVLSSSEPEIKITQEGWESFKYLVLNEFKPYHFTTNYHIDKDFVGTGEVTAIGSSPEGEFGEVHWFFHVLRFKPFWDPYDSGNWQILSKIPSSVSGKYAVFNNGEKNENIIDSITLHKFTNAKKDGEFRLVYDLAEKSKNMNFEKIKIIKKYGDYIQVIDQRFVAGKLASKNVASGDYLVMYDDKEPVIGEFDFLEDGFIEVEITDEISGIKSVVVNGVSEFEKTVDGNIITLKIPLKDSKKIYIEAEDQFGNISTKSFQEKITTATVSSSYCYPNPAETTSRIAVNFSAPLAIGDGDNTVLKIFDLQGAKVLETSSFSVTGAMLYYDWDLSNDLGYKVSNGTYHYRIIIPEKGNMKLTGKVTVLR